MISELILMKGYGLYVWSAFSFTFLSFLVLFLITRSQYNKEKNKFISKYGSLDSERAAFARSQSINKEILSNTSNI
ncbi:heme exporter protein CcmD [Candidatus Pelagibacter sp.]|nr:heme exporter protein CcmD [Candidatus Pelagibacter sp.]